MIGLLVVTPARLGGYFVGEHDFPKAFHVETLNQALSLVCHLMGEKTYTGGPR